MLTADRMTLGEEATKKDTDQTTPADSAWLKAPARHMGGDMQTVRFWRDFSAHVPGPHLALVALWRCGRASGPWPMDRPNPDFPVAGGESGVSGFISKVRARRAGSGCIT
jgi:hypothetical protein